MQSLAAQRLAAGNQTPAVPTAASGLHLHGHNTALECGQALRYFYCCYCVLYCILDCANSRCTTLPLNVFK